MMLPKKGFKNEHGASGISAVFRGSQKYLGKL